MEKKITILWGNETSEMSRGPTFSLLFFFSLSLFETSELFGTYENEIQNMKSFLQGANIKSHTMISLGKVTPPPHDQLSLKNLQLYCELCIYFVCHFSPTAVIFPFSPFFF